MVTLSAWLGRTGGLLYMIYMVGVGQIGLCHGCDTSGALYKERHSEKVVVTALQGGMACRAT